MTAWIWRFHWDERGSLSIVSVFTLVLLVFLLGMVVNTARQVDHKIKLQNAADAATYSGGVVLTRGMNTLAFTNHLLADVFALTAFLREARDRSAESLTPEILDNWERVAPAFQGSEFPPFDRLGLAIAEKVPREREMVFTFGNWAQAGSELMLPVLETILAEELIPQYQRALTLATPVIAQYAIDETARRHGNAWPRPAEVHGVLWRTLVDPVGGGRELDRRTLPVVDPVLDGPLSSQHYFQDAVQQRHDLAHRYLAAWNRESMRPFDQLGKMSQFGNLWRIFTCGHLEHLLNVEYPQRNLPFQIRHQATEIEGDPQLLELDFTWVGVVYRSPLDDRIPRIFRNPIRWNSQAYTQIQLFVPRQRLVYVRPTSESPQPEPLGGIPGQEVHYPSPPGSDDPGSRSVATEFWQTVRQSGSYHPSHWDLLNQNWTMQRVPAVSPSILGILSTPPPVSSLPNYQLPDLDSFTEVDLQWLSHH